MTSQQLLQAESYQNPRTNTCKPKECHNKHGGDRQAVPAQPNARLARKHKRTYLLAHGTDNGHGLQVRTQLRRFASLGGLGRVTFPLRLGLGAVAATHGYPVGRTRWATERTRGGPAAGNASGEKEDVQHTGGGGGRVAQHLSAQSTVHGMARSSGSGGKTAGVRTTGGSSAQVETARYAAHKC